MNLNLPENLKDKIYQIKANSQNHLKIVSYFPLSEDEKLMISTLNNLQSLDVYCSIFSDNISEQEWNKSKFQILKRFQDELFDID